MDSPAHIRIEKGVRYHGLDLVRSVAMLLGLVLHVSIFFMEDQRIWMMSQHQTDPLNGLLYSFVHMFRMQLFFMMAGFFAQLVIERKGGHPFWRDRIKRILIPFLFAAIVLVPLHDLVISSCGQPGMVRQYMMSHSLIDTVKAVIFYGLLVDQYPREFVGFWHYWFVYYLLWMYLVHAVIRCALPQSIGKATSGFCGWVLRRASAALWMGLLCVPVHYSLTDPDFLPNHLNFEFNNFGYYLIFYLFGIGLCRQRQLLPKLEKYCFFNISIGCMLVPLVPTLTPFICDIQPSVAHDVLSLKWVGFHWVSEAVFEGGAFKLCYVLMRACGAWLLCFGFIGLAERYLKVGHPVVQYLSDSSYWIFYSHMIFTFSFSFLSAKIAWGNSLTKSYLIFVPCTYFLWWTYNRFVRYSWLGDFFMSRRKRRGSQGGDLHISTLQLIKWTWKPASLGLLFAFVIGQAFKERSMLVGEGFLKEAQIAQQEDYFDRAESLDQVLDRFGRSALHLAAMTSDNLRDYNVIEKLLPHFEHPNLRDVMGRTPLFNASRAGNVGDVRFLLAAGANPDLADRFGHTAAHASAIKLHLKDPAASERHRQILEILREHGADFTLLDHMGRNVSTLMEKL